ncbi:hypothetical protein [Devosia rhizoryzae]|uniref:Uncharacterized protein n=1 Tax=Devosia rhizoryzae TaxID=2774137 RepID=A0ABX7C6Q4_9HYPH|nr:hypothetical protein [Devosia rhizoryzae]QQR39933.1 hypothetical protein JI748_02645 [Devosia rhizoryzae]
MPSETPGRLIEVKTKFHSEALKPGGIARSGAHMAAVRSVAALKAQVEQQLDTCIAPLAETLRNWPAPDVAKACEQAAQIRDTAGLADMHLLTEVAMHSFDCLDAVLIDGATMERAEAVCYADALIFARQNRGTNIEPFLPLLKDLESLTTLVISRNRKTA